MWKIRLSDLNYDEAEERAVLEVLRSQWLTMGEVTERFENAFAEFIGVKHAIAVTNCTAALQLAYRAVGVKDGDEVVLPSLTFVATANAAMAEGASPVFADVSSENDLTVSSQDIVTKLTTRTRAVVLVHYAGFPCDADPVLEMAHARGIAVVEDCAHSPGAKYKGRMTGALGDVGCFSFFSNKNLATGEGGMLTTNDDQLAARLRLLRSHGMTSVTLDRHRGHAFGYDVVETGYNFRMDEIRSALGLVQLEKLPRANARRREIVMQYRAGLKNISGVKVPFAEQEGAWHIMPVLLRPGTNRPGFIRGMQQAGVQTSIHYPPVHTFSSYRALKGAAATRLPITEALAERLVTLPLHPRMSAEDVDLVIGAVRELA